MQLRASTLRKALDRILDDKEPPEGQANVNLLSKRFFDHPLIRSLAESERDPDYIPATAFRSVLFDLITPQDASNATAVVQIVEATKSTELGKTLGAIARSSGGDLRAFGEAVESWFNSSMERVTGWYKRRVQHIVVALAVSITVICNADTIELARRISHDGLLRAALVANAQSLGAARDPTTRPVIDIATLQGLGLNFGWGSDGMVQYPSRNADSGEWIGFVATKLIGLLLTAMAVSLGAPFWFDVLNKVVTVRAAGRAPEEGPKKPDDHPKRWS
jgi:hypothetical protein